MKKLILSTILATAAIPAMAESPADLLTSPLHKAIGTYYSLAVACEPHTGKSDLMLARVQMQRYFQKKGNYNADEAVVLTDAVEKRTKKELDKPAAKMTLAGLDKKICASLTVDYMQTMKLEWAKSNLGMVE
jgi:hypothetical protein